MTDPTNDDVTEGTIQELLSPYKQALNDRGIGPKLLARKRKQQLNAKSVKHIKIKGKLEPDVKLPPGYKVISYGGVVDGPQGASIFDDAVIEYRGVDWGIQTKATESIEKILGLHTEKTEVVHSGTVQMTNFPPQPKSIEEWEEQYRKHAEEDNAENSPDPDRS